MTEEDKQMIPKAMIPPPLPLAIPLLIRFELPVAHTPRSFVVRPSLSCLVWTNANALYVINNKTNFEKPAAIVNTFIWIANEH